eukprot:jgi/Chlat1/429/Chrsp103S00942
MGEVQSQLALAYRPRRPRLRPASYRFGALSLSVGSCYEISPPQVGFWADLATTELERRKPWVVQVLALQPNKGRASFLRARFFVLHHHLQLQHTLQLRLHELFEGCEEEDLDPRLISKPCVVLPWHMFAIKYARAQPPPDKPVYFYQYKYFLPNEDSEFGRIKLRRNVVKFWRMSFMELPELVLAGFDQLLIAAVQSTMSATTHTAKTARLHGIPHEWVASRLRQLPCKQSPRSLLFHPFVDDDECAVAVQRFRDPLDAFMPGWAERSFPFETRAVIVVQEVVMRYFFFRQLLSVRCPFHTASVEGEGVEAIVSWRSFSSTLQGNVSTFSIACGGDVYGSIDLVAPCSLSQLLEAITDEGWHMPSSWRFRTAHGVVDLGEEENVNALHPHTEGWVVPHVVEVIVV